MIDYDEILKTAGYAKAIMTRDVLLIPNIDSTEPNNILDAIFTFEFPLFWLQFCHA